MNKQRLLILIGLIIAISSGWAMNRYAAELDKKLPVVVAKMRVNQLEKFTTDNLEVVQMPPRYILPGAFTSLEQVAGKLSGTRVYKGEQIIWDKISKNQIVINDNERLLFIPCKTVLMKPYQKVDIYMVYQLGKSQKSGSQAILTGKVVANVIDERGISIYDDSKATLDYSRGQAGIEIIASAQEIAYYLNELQIAKETVVRYGEGEI